MFLKHLQYPLYKLYYIDCINEFHGLTAFEVASFKETYSSDLQEDIRLALEWAQQDESIDLTQVLPGIRCSNQEIHEYVRKVAKSLE